ncbi:arabinofuranosidase, partial [Micromonospora sp. DH15]|nr:arabinofuranosidase [Micromonospora sp. DH15]
MVRTVRRSWRRAALTAATVLASLVAALPSAGAAPASAAAPPPGQTSRYTMTAFTNSSESNMYVYESADATGYRLLRGPAYTPPTGLIRDPSIIRHTDGRYYVVYTTNWTGNTIGFATSTDRVNWTFLRNHTIPMTVNNTWAPEWFVDSDVSVNESVSHSTNAADFTPYRL